jgi:hypothetical protein
MNTSLGLTRIVAVTAGAALFVPLGLVSTTARATTPCGDFEECQVLIEINASAGDLGFHWVIDGDDLVATNINDPNGLRVFENRAFHELWQQYFTETRGESAEPVCRKSLAEPGEDVLTVRQFVKRFPAGTYTIRGVTDEGDVLWGKTPFTHWIPAAPRSVSYSGGVISWQPGTALGVCATEAELWQMVSDGVLPVHPMNVPIKEWEVTFETLGKSPREFTLRLPARGPNAQMSVTVSPEFLNSVGPDTPAKLEVGAVGGKLSIGDDDNATFTELGGICLHKVNGCPVIQPD